MICLDGEGYGLTPAFDLLPDIGARRRGQNISHPARLS